MLARAGFPVPAGYALSCEAAERCFEQVLPPELRPASLFTRQDVPEAELEQAAQRVRQAPLPADLRTELGGALGRLRAGGARSVAVRSSSIAEDQDAAAAAGLHISLLHVQTEAALFDAVRACWASVFQTRVLRYLHTLGIDGIGSLGVVVQAMVAADAAGVLFTVNPLTGDPDELVINAAFGLGTLVTDGSVSPDT